MTLRHLHGVTLILLAVLVLPADVRAQGRGGPPPGGAPRPSPRAMAPADVTGYWVSVVTEDWRYRMLTPAKGDYQGLQMSPEARKIADSWDPSADVAAGNQCRSYGAAAIMRGPGRIHITWQDDNTLRLDADAGTQTRLFRFGPPQPPGPPQMAGRAQPAGSPTWQGESAAQWETTGGGRGAAPVPAPGASLRVVTRNMRAGYLRKNGVPYSEDAVLTEHFTVAPIPSGGQTLVVTSVVQDPRYFPQPFVVSSVFKKQADASGWDPTPCSATW